MEYRGGDCDDLTILYCALLEAVGFETAFITVPGHIFMAFSLDQSPAEALTRFSHPEELVIKENKAWIPLEVTAREGGFLKAWQMGAQEWRENAEVCSIPRWLHLVVRVTSPGPPIQDGTLHVTLSISIGQSGEKSAFRFASRRLLDRVCQPSGAIKS